MTMRKLLAPALVAVLAAACASGGAPSSTPRMNRYVITVEEMRAQKIVHGEEAVRVLRPTWMQQRGATTFGVENQVRIYTDTSIKPLSGLHGVPDGQTPAVLYFPPLEAQTRFGLNHSQGAIAILLPGGSLP
jgi:hypothetical protein